MKVLEFCFFGGGFFSKGVINMIVVCCVCNKVFKKTKRDKGVVSHGYCKECLKKVRKEMGLDKKKDK
ncbi:hypothetical protein ES707_22745 [subsurface metagenome]